MKKLLKKIISFFTSCVYEVIQSKKRLNPIDEFKKETFLESYNYFKKYFVKANLFKVSLNQKKNFTFSINLFEHSFFELTKNKIKLNEYLFLEFGTYKGQSATIISSILKKHTNNILYTFDSFKGLSDSWPGSSKYQGTFKLDTTPKLPDNCKIIEGLIQDNLEGFLKEHQKKVIFVHCDVDTYETTKYILEKIKGHLINGSIIIFDDLYNRAGWKEGQIKALKEVFEEEYYNYISFSDSGQAAIKIIK